MGIMKIPSTKNQIFDAWDLGFYCFIKPINTADLEFFLTSP
jgi:hypothetical protein